MEELLKETSKELKLPIPVNRGILVKNPLDQKEFLILLDDKQKAEFAEKKLIEMFPDGTIKYEVVAMAAGLTIPVKLGDKITINQTAKHRMQYINGGNYLGFTEGDVAFVWPLENE